MYKWSRFLFYYVVEIIFILFSFIEAERFLIHFAISQLVVTAGSDAVLHVWRYNGPSAAQSLTASGMMGAAASSAHPGTRGSSAGTTVRGPGLSARAAAVCYLDTGREGGDAITSMVACRRGGRPIPQMIVGTASGTVVVVSMETSSSFFAAASDPSGSAPEAAPSGIPSTIGEHVEPIQARVCWELRVFDAPISAVALNHHGDCCAISCASRNQVIIGGEQVLD